jgi:uncharacterized protein
MDRTGKPSKNEEEYFAKLDAERIKRKRHELLRLAQHEERSKHYMKCPKCGADLATVEFHRIQVHRCPECHGLWLDNAEIDAVVAHEDKSLLTRALGDFLSGLRRARSK